MEPSEVDGPEDVKDGSVKGVKNAAVRKLEHELGIPVGELKVEGFKFLTRLHYWAADTVSHFALDLAFDSSFSRYFLCEFFP